MIKESSNFSILISTQSLNLVPLHITVKTFRQVLSLFGQALSLFGQGLSLWTRFNSPRLASLQLAKNYAIKRVLWCSKIEGIIPSPEGCEDLDSGVLSSKGCPVVCVVKMCGIFFSRMSMRWGCSALSSEGCSVYGFEMWDIFWRMSKFVPVVKFRGWCPKEGKRPSSEIWPETSETVTNSEIYYQVWGKRQELSVSDTKD
jgi:hypothetical protein